MHTAAAKLPHAEVVARYPLRRNPISGVRVAGDPDLMEVRALADACEDEARRAGLIDAD